MKGVLFRNACQAEHSVSAAFLPTLMFKPVFPLVPIRLTCGALNSLKMGEPQDRRPICESNLSSTHNILACVVL